MVYKMNKLCFILLLNAGVRGFNFLGRVRSYEFLMPSIYPYKDGLYLCTQIMIRNNFYIVGFEPITSMQTPHYMILYGCTEPETDFFVWRCSAKRRMKNKASPCRNESQVVYVWSRGAPGFDLPKNVGFHIGVNSTIKYLVLQVQYSHRYRDGTTDSSGVLLKYTNKRTRHQAGVLLLGTSSGVIPSRRVAHMETACTILENKTIHPIAYSTHTHSLATAVSGYVVRQGPSADSWSTLGKIDPQLPQWFHPVVDARPIQDGDTLAARCTMYNNRDYAVKIGIRRFVLQSHYIAANNIRPISKDARASEIVAHRIQNEICNFYLMYSVYIDSPLKLKYCVLPGPPKYSWSKAIARFKNIPDKEASTL